MVYNAGDSTAELMKGLTTMAAARKTVNVAQIVDKLHAMIRTTDNVDMKKAYCSAIEEILHASGNYHGYGHTFWTYEVMIAYNFRVDDAIAAGVGTEYDRMYYY